MEGTLATTENGRLGETGFEDFDQGQKTGRGRAIVKTKQFHIAAVFRIEISRNRAALAFVVYAADPPENRGGGVADRGRAGAETTPPQLAQGEGTNQYLKHASESAQPPTST